MSVHDVLRKSGAIMAVREAKGGDWGPVVVVPCSKVGGW